jgi:hypothetical protein
MGTAGWLFVATPSPPSADVDGGFEFIVEGCGCCSLHCGLVISKRVQLKSEKNCFHFHRKFYRFFHDLPFIGLEKFIGFLHCNQHFSTSFARIGQFEAITQLGRLLHDIVDSNRFAENVKYKYNLKSLSSIINNFIKIKPMKSHIPIKLTQNQRIDLLRS